ncbi:hypothetical protein ACRXCV_00175 (plasmid) [Halobacteriovorax sp. GFR7]|uniref:hypothetical protein n=1 Tax=unclassified Halobacteriovorax TaxID=2639665 RepID=UPI003D96B515
MGKYLLLLVALAVAYMWGMQDAQAEELTLTEPVPQLDYEMKRQDKKYAIHCERYGAILYTDHYEEKGDYLAIAMPVTMRGKLQARIIIAYKPTCTIMVF